MADKQLSGFHCIPQKGWLGGVCAGVAYMLGLPLWVVRLVWFLVANFYGVGLGLYLLLWIFVPNAASVPADFAERTR